MGTSIINVVTCNNCTKNNNNINPENEIIKIKNGEILSIDGSKETYEALKDNTPIPKNLIDVKIQTKDLIQKKMMTYLNIIKKYHH